MRAGAARAAGGTVGCYMGSGEEWDGQLRLVWGDADTASPPSKGTSHGSEESVKSLARVMDTLGVGSACPVCGGRLEKFSVVPATESTECVDGLTCCVCGSSVERQRGGWGDQRVPEEG